MSNKQIDMKDLVDIFAFYIEKTLGLPDRNVRIGYEQVKARALVPDPTEGDSDGPEFCLIEEELPDDLREELEEITIYEEDLSLYISFNSFNFEWCIYFAPTKEIGFEVTGSSLQEVIEVAYSNIENRIFYDSGAPKTVDIDEEWRIYSGGMNGC